MIFSHNWLKDLVPDLDVTVSELAESLTSHSFETEIINKISINPLIKVVKILHVEKHPRADRLNLVTITDGSKETKVVCGAKNISAGDVVPYSPPGAEVRGDDKNPFLVKEAKIRGVSSPGMLNSPRELSLGPWHGGIYLLPPDTPVGSRLADLIIPDTIIEADIQPNRAHDCFSHLGLAREIAALFNLKVEEPEYFDLPERKNIENWSFTIENEKDTPRYTASLFKNIKIKTSPLWLQSRLWAMGVHPINNVVDITNYVMYEIGNPVHAFDIQKLPEKNILVRRAKRGEQIKNLDNTSSSLTSDNLLITSGDKPVAVAGIIGGQTTQVTPVTEEIILESANFKGFVVQQSCAAIKKSTESSARFTRQLPIQLASQAAARAAYLLNSLAEANVEWFSNTNPQKPSKKIITINPSLICDLAGINIDNQTIKDILTRLRCSVNTSKTDWSVTVPDDRLDLMLDHDLAEEVIRVYGLSNINSQKESFNQIVKLPQHYIWREAVRDTLINTGLTETYNYSFEFEPILEKLNLKIADTEKLEIANPRSQEQKFLRTTLLPRIINNALANKQHFRKLSGDEERALFEINHVFTAGKSTRVAGVKEEDKIAGVIIGRNASFELTQAIIENILRLFDINPVIYSKIKPVDFWSDNACQIKFSNNLLGIIGSLNPVTPFYQQTGLAMMMFEISLDLLVELTDVVPKPNLAKEEKPRQYIKQGKYPASYRDLSILIDPKFPIDKIQSLIETVGGDIVKDTDLIDIYESDNLSGEASPRRSLTFHITYQSPTHTLKDQEINEVHNNIVAQLKAELDAELRE